MRTATKMTEPQKALMRHLIFEKLENKSYTSGLVYANAADFLFQHGVWHDGPWIPEYGIGPSKQCYGRAIVMGALHGIPYVEGYALAPNGLAIPHAWNLTEEGALLDTTWANQGLAYLGVEFSLERADDATWNGDACILDDSKRGHPLFRLPWAGEDFSLAWDPSERLEMLRNRKEEELRAWVGQQKRRSNDAE